MTTRSAKISFLTDRASNVGAFEPGSYLRLTGIVRYFDTAKRWCQIEDENNFFVVDLQLCDMAGIDIGKLFQFIGEVSPVLDQVRFQGCGDDVCLHATLARCVDGLDLGLYKQAVAARDKYLDDMMR
ncbi:hypothetical protein EON64_11455 [archaeon]|nr:MAG: hypothetical protein EON64_11455 [archaeon]